MDDRLKQCKYFIEQLKKHFYNVIPAYALSNKTHPPDKYLYPISISITINCETFSHPQPWHIFIVLKIVVIFYSIWDTLILKPEIHVW